MMLIVTRLGVRMAVDRLQVPFGSLESQITILDLLRVHLLFALSLAGRHVTIALLLL
jgi:hypothetical protein